MEMDDIFLQADSVTLSIDLQASPFSTREDSLVSLWHELKANTVEPLQASALELTSFADECLFCALIRERRKVHYDDEDLLGSSSYLETQECTLSQPSNNDPIGLIYVHSSPSNIPAREVNVGIVVCSQKRRRGYAREAMLLALGWVFDELKFHRAQAAIMDVADKDRAILFFTSVGFSHEGIRRRSVYQPRMDGRDGEWKDVTYLAMLDTDWVVRKSLIARGCAPSTLWEELLNRHAKEREALAMWEERHGRLKRTTSMETVRRAPKSNAAEKQKMTLEVDQLLLYTSDQSSMPSTHGSAPPSPGPKINISWVADANGEDSSNRFNHHWLRATSSQVELLPSIPSAYPSITGSEYPITIPSPSSPPPDTPSIRSSSPEHDSDSEILEFGDVLSQTNLIHHDTIPRALVNLPGSSNPSLSSCSSSVPSENSWCDARSSVSSEWDIVGSNPSEGGNSSRTGKSRKRRAKRRRGGPHQVST
ncbi:hypothetical protein EDD17DRAFT_922070 [Pisolithus thermaeus]|nr:hypothetical protein EDD17DRAFT_922070 [Pisolithus thermaeus]